MTRETQSRYLKRKNDNESWQNVTGFVTKVHEHTGEEDQISNHEVNVQTSNQAEEFKKVPVHTDHNGSIYVPQVNDMVELGFLQSKTQRPFVSNVVYTNEQRAPLARSGHFRRRFDGPEDSDLFLEAEKRDHSAGDPDTVRLAVKEDGLSDPVARIEVDLSGSDPVLRLTRGEEEQGNTDMGLELDFGSGEFKLGDGSGFGIVSDGNGNFEWYEKSVNFIDDGSTINW